MIFSVFIVILLVALTHKKVDAFYSQALKPFHFYPIQSESEDDHERQEVIKRFQNMNSPKLVSQGQKIIMEEIDDIAYHEAMETKKILGELRGNFTNRFRNTWLNFHGRDT